MVDGITDYKQGSKSQMVVTDNLSKIFQLAAIYLFFFPSEFVAGSKRIFLTESFPSNSMYLFKVTIYFLRIIQKSKNK